MMRRDSPPPTAPRRPAAWRWQARLLACALVGCGGSGGVDTGGTGVPVASFTSGPVSGLGSVTVNGVRFDDLNANFGVAGSSCSKRDDLRLGMTVEIEGSAVKTDNSATALRVTCRTQVAGAVQAAPNTTNGTFLVLGQTITVDASTLFDASLPNGLASIARGTPVVVFGQLADASTGRYTARLVQAAGAATNLIRGIATAVDAANSRLTVGGQTVDYKNLGPVTGLAAGKAVRVTVQSTQQPPGVWVASAIKVESDDAEDRSEASVDGRVSLFTSAAAFNVDGLPIDARSASRPNGDVTATGQRVQVKGRITGGVLVATEVQVSATSGGGGGGGGGEVEPVELHGFVVQLDTAARTFQVRDENPPHLVRDIVVVYDPVNTIFIGGAATDLRNDKKVELKGPPTQNGTRVLATRIQFDN